MDSGAGPARQPTNIWPRPRQTCSLAVSTIPEGLASNSLDPERTAPGGGLPPRPPDPNIWQWHIGLLMLIEEAQWLCSKLDALDPDRVFPMCNIGSSTEHFRRVEQPYIDKYLFEPARARNLKVVHVDTKAAAGIDLVGDLTDPNFLRRVTTLNIKSVMCCNLLEHVTNRQIICDAMRSMVRPGGYLFLTVPYRFPYHEDPIDTMFRPTIDELARL